MYIYIYACININMYVYIYMLICVFDSTHICPDLGLRLTESCTWTFTWFLFIKPMHLLYSIHIRGFLSHFPPRKHKKNANRII